MSASIFLVEAEHFGVPGRKLRAFATKAGQKPMRRSAIARKQDVK